MMHHFGLDFYTIRDVMSWNNIVLLNASVPAYKSPDKKNTEPEKSPKTIDEELAMLKKMGL